jgi:hypothetical protein
MLARNQSERFRTDQRRGFPLGHVELLAIIGALQHPALSRIACFMIQPFRVVLHHWRCRYFGFDDIFGAGAHYCGRKPETRIRILLVELRGE